MPLAAQFVLNAVDPAKDVDGFHPVSVGRMMLGLPTYLPCTPHGILHILKRSGIGTRGAHVVIVGRSNIVGRPLANLLSQKNELGNATVTLCHTGTKDVAQHTRQADIVVAAGPGGGPHVKVFDGRDLLEQKVLVRQVQIRSVPHETSDERQGWIVHDIHDYRLVGWLF